MVGRGAPITSSWWWLTRGFAERCCHPRRFLPPPASQPSFLKQKCGDAHKRCPALRFAVSQWRTGEGQSSTLNNTKAAISVFCTIIPLYRERFAQYTTGQCHPDALLGTSIDFSKDFSALMNGRTVSLSLSLFFFICFSCSLSILLSFSVPLCLSLSFSPLIFFLPSLNSLLTARLSGGHVH